MSQTGHLGQTAGWLGVLLRQVRPGFLAYKRPLRAALHGTGPREGAWRNAPTCRTDTLAPPLRLATKNAAISAFIEDFLRAVQMNSSPAGPISPELPSAGSRGCRWPRAVPAPTRATEARAGRAGSRAPVQARAFLFGSDPHQSQAGERAVRAATGEGRERHAVRGRKWCGGWRGGPPRTVSRQDTD